MGRPTAGRRADADESLEAAGAPAPRREREAARAIAYSDALSSTRGCCELERELDEKTESRSWRAHRAAAAGSTGLPRKRPAQAALTPCASR